MADHLTISAASCMTLVESPEVVWATYVEETTEAKALSLRTHYKQQR